MEEDDTDDNNVALKALNEFIKNDTRVTATMLWIGDGTTIAVKK